MLEAIAEIHEPSGERLGQESRYRLHEPVGQVPRKKSDFLEPRIDCSLECEKAWQPVRAEPVDHQQHVLAVSMRQVETVAVEIFTTDR